MTGVGAVTFTSEAAALSSLPPGSVVSSLEDTTLVLHLGTFLDTGREIRKLKDRIEKNERDRKKLAKATKGKFQYRETKEAVEEKGKVLDQELERLQEQLKVLEELEEKEELKD